MKVDDLSPVTLTSFCSLHHLEASLVSFLSRNRVFNHDENETMERE